MTIDLHGYREDEAVGMIQSALFSLEDGSVDEINIITGNGYVLRDLAIELVEEAGFHWENASSTNTGSLIVR